MDEAMGWNSFEFRDKTYKYYGSHGKKLVCRKLLGEAMGQALGIYPDMSFADFCKKPEMYKILQHGKG